MAAQFRTSPLAALGGDLGIDVDLGAVPADGAKGTDALLFAESNSRFVLTCAPEKAAELEQLFAGLPLARVGSVAEAPRMAVSHSGRTVVDESLDALRRAFRGTLDGI